MFTKGDWIKRADLVFSSEKRMICEVSEPDSDSVQHKQVYLDSKNWNEAMANAQLISAAPDLLKACQMFIEAYEKSLQIEKTDKAMRMARIAVIKAIGESNE